MAKCEYCNQDMTKVDSCSFTHILIGDKTYKRNTKYHDINKRCHDCNIVNGKTHHFGCDMEMCPKCKDQLAFCDCDKKYLCNKHNED